MAEFLVAGAGGMLGSAFSYHLGGAAQRLGRAALNTSDLPGISEAVKRAEARIVINCAAHTNVDEAEATPDAAWRVNALLPGILGTACRRTGALLVHMSSTGVYGDWKAEPYDEDDVPRPTTVHHRSKVAGEAAVRESGCEHLIVRTGWLFGGRPDQPKNFVWKRILDAAAAPVLMSDARQRGNPTATTDVVRQVLAVIRYGYCGTINAVSQGSATRHDYIARIVAAANIDCQVLADPTPFTRAARVSPNEVAVNRRLQLLEADIMPAWDSAVDDYVRTLRATPEWHGLEKRT